MKAGDIVFVRTKGNLKLARKLAVKIIKKLKRRSQAKRKKK